MCLLLLSYFFVQVMLIGSGLAAHYGVFFLFRAMEHLKLPRSTKYADLGEAVYGRKGRLAVQWSICLGLISVGMMPVRKKQTSHKHANTPTRPPPFAISLSSTCDR